ncbi:S41 family peptidase [Streptomyces sp. HNM0574]|uniref:S41 family peptidase n=1 Tax=Streptomyces sp. HNM0574 TaxID=2714954 RepID=UPI001469A671|nr:S41 family peptidase [Streptomyces sp. HNM0574]NLU69084.1 S41 family peptidase [Streptomyces sp. HNM0574]
MSPHNSAPRRGRTATALVAALASAAVLAVPGCGGAAGGRERGGGLEGVWRTEGYGTSVVVEGRGLRTYETTRISCVPGALRGSRKGGTGPGGRATYVTDGAAEVTLTPEGRGRARMRIADNTGSRTLHRAEDGLPARCGEPESRDPRHVFDVFWQTFAEHYPFFAAKGVDWRAVREKWRPRITRSTTGAELFEVFRSMLEPLHDAHTAVAGDGRRYAGIRPGTAPPGPAFVARVDKATRAAVGTRLKQWANGAVAYARLGDGTGYLRLTRFEGFTGEDDHAADTAALDRALREIFAEAPRWRGLVLDVRFHGGGADPLGLRVASRLTARPYLGYAKRARNDPADPRRFTRPEPVRVTPHEGLRFTGPVAVLTSRYTVSAGESFVQALLGRRPAPALVGEPTQGVFSDTLDRRLPGGWTFSLPNEEYLTADGRTFDGAGIPPGHRTPVFTEEEFARHRDTALERARALLHGR